MLYIKNLSITNNKTQVQIIDTLTLSLNKNDKLALIGEEGSGKSSFIKALFYHTLDYASLSYEQIQSGFISYVSQETVFNGAVYEFIQSEDYQELYTLCARINMDSALLYRDDFNTLSGGEKTKLAIIKAFLEKPDILILDEPTNNLDIESIIALERLCQTFEGILIYASHDTKFIENTANKILHFENIKRRTENRQTFYNMNYKDFIDKRQATIQTETKVYEAGRKEVAIAEKRYERVHDNVHHALKTISRQEPQAAKNLKDKMRQVKSVGKKIEKKKDALQKPRAFEEAIDIRFKSEGVHQNKLILDLNLKELKIDDTILSKQIQLQIKGPEKIAILGENGSGKTTLIKEIMDKLTCKYVYMPQNYEDIFDTDLNAIALLADVKDKEDRENTMTYLASLNFSYEEMYLPFKELSGGQKAKLFFGKMAQNKTELLILDEPTRNISSLSIDTLIREIQKFQGAIILVSHDRKLLEALTFKSYQLDPLGLHKKSSS